MEAKLAIVGSTSSASPTPGKYFRGEFKITEYKGRCQKMSTKDMNVYTSPKIYL